MRPLKITMASPAKVNLYLHVTGKRNDGYHLLDSIVTFVKGVEDVVTIEPSDAFGFQVTGPFASGLSGNDLSPEKNSSNLVVRAARSFAELSGIDPCVSITLKKNIPMGAGLGGGSGDAAATFKGLEKFYDVEISHQERDKELLKLGADVPVCYAGQPCRFEGIGEIITSLAVFAKMHILLVWPNKPSMTKDVFFRTVARDYAPAAHIPAELQNPKQLIGFLKSTDNNLTRGAIEGCAPIQEALQALLHQNGCVLSRMTGSGSCVFGLFENTDDLNKAKSSIENKHPDWWIQSGQI